MRMSAATYAGDTGGCNFSDTSSGNFEPVFGVSDTRKCATAGPEPSRAPKGRKFTWTPLDACPLGAGRPRPIPLGVRTDLDVKDQKKLRLEERSQRLFSWVQQVEKNHQYSVGLEGQGGKYPPLTTARQLLDIYTPEYQKFYLGTLLAASFHFHHGCRSTTLKDTVLSMADCKRTLRSDGSSLGGSCNSSVISSCSSSRHSSRTTTTTTLHSSRGMASPGGGSCSLRHGDDEDGSHYPEVASPGGRGRGLAALGHRKPVPPAAATSPTHYSSLDNNKKSIRGGGGGVRACLPALDTPGIKRPTQPATTRPMSSSHTVSPTTTTGSDDPPPTISLLPMLCFEETEGEDEDDGEGVVHVSLSPGRVRRQDKTSSRKSSSVSPGSSCSSYSAGWSTSSCHLLPKVGSPGASLRSRPTSPGLTPGSLGGSTLFGGPVSPGASLRAPPCDPQDSLGTSSSNRSTKSLEATDKKRKDFLQCSSGQSRMYASTTTPPRQHTPKSALLPLPVGSPGRATSARGGSRKVSSSNPEGSCSGWMYQVREQKFVMKSPQEKAEDEEVAIFRSTQQKKLAALESRLAAEAKMVAGRTASMLAYRKIFDQAFAPLLEKLLNPICSLDDVDAPPRASNCLLAHEEPNNSSRHLPPPAPCPPCSLAAVSALRSLPLWQVDSDSQGNPSFPKEAKTTESPRAPRKEKQSHHFPLVD